MWNRYFVKLLLHRLIISSQSYALKRREIAVMSTGETQFLARIDNSGFRALRSGFWKVYLAKRANIEAWR